VSRDADLRARERAARMSGCAHEDAALDAAACRLSVAPLAASHYRCSSGHVERLSDPEPLLCGATFYDSCDRCGEAAELTGVLACLTCGAYSLWTDATLTAQGARGCGVCYAPTPREQRDERSGVQDCACCGMAHMVDDAHGPATLCDECADHGCDASGSSPCAME
jgi:hypothetical protein